jgi:Transcription factor WhiB
MRRKIDRDAVDWDKAQCRGINTDIFYLEDEHLKNKKAENRQLRNICFRCPIQRACLEVGFAYERFGMWGGVAAYERQEILNDKLDAARLAPLRRDCDEFGVPFEKILEASLVERMGDEVSY